MPLPVSAEYPSVPIVMYDQYHPPTVPMVNVPQALQHVLPMVSAAVANEASMKANAHAARMFCYNLLVNNFWQNEAFAEVVKLTMDVISMNMMRNLIRSPEQNLQQTVAEVLTLWSCNMLFCFPDLKHMCGPQIVDAAAQNIQTFNNLKQEIMNMNGSMQPVYHAAPVMDPRFNMGGNAHAPMGQQYMNPSIGGGNYMQPNNTPTFPASNAFSNSNTGIRFGSVATDITTDRFSSRPQRELPQPAFRNEPEPVITTTMNKKTSSNCLIIDGGSEVERSKHQITFFGDRYSTDGAIRNRQFAVSTQQLTETEIPNVVPDAEEQDETDFYFLNPTWFLEACLESAILIGKGKQFEKQQNNSSINVYRCFTTTANPILSVYEVKGYFDTICGSTSFVDMADNLKSLASSLAAKDDDKQYTDCIISVLNNVDIIMTDIVNDFLNQNLGLRKVRIDNFSEDIGDVRDYLNNKFGINYAQAFAQFETDVIRVVTEKMDEESIEAVNANINTPEGLHVGNLPLNHSMTFILMNAKELGYKVGSDSLIIEADVAPTLYNIAKSLQQHKKDMGMPTIFDWLITADGVRYKLYKNNAVADQYLIAKA